MVLVNMMHNQQFEQQHPPTDLDSLLKRFTLETMRSVRAIKDQNSIFDDERLVSCDSEDRVIVTDELEAIPLSPSGLTVPVVACDMSTVKIAETQEGLVWAVRGSIVIKKHGRTSALLIGPFAYTASSENVYNILQTLYQALGMNGKRPIFSLDAAPKLVGNLFEKILQLYAASLLEGGVLLLDGSLTVGPLDSPVEVVRKIVDVAKHHGMGVAAFSKSTTITFRGKSILSYETSIRPPYIVKLSCHDRAGWPVRNGFIYVSHLSPVYFPFRVDVSSKQSDTDLFKALLSSENIIYGYPESLILAHQLAKITRLDVISIKASLEASLRVRFLSTFPVRSSIFSPLAYS
ncbi:MAG: DNA double-strand break repair nuclease NurA [Candidatus Caldarchaeum sp.]|nr:DNA double-strand break repair nuclease NurA [Candidatus Caldarchaeum sp.]